MVAVGCKKVNVVIITKDCLYLLYLVGLKVWGNFKKEVVCLLRNFAFNGNIIC